MYITEVLCCTEVNNTTLQVSYEVKWQPVSRVRLCDPVDHTVQGIVQARILERVAFPFSRGSSQPRDRTRVSLMAGEFFTSWATREAQISYASIKIWKWIKQENISSLLLQAHMAPWDQGQTSEGFAAEVRTGAHLERIFPAFAPWLLPVFKCLHAAPRIHTHSTLLPTFRSFPVLFPR